MRADRHLGGVFRPLGAGDKPAYLEHLLRLDQTSRRQRYHRVMSDAALEARTDQVFADREIHLIGWFKRGVLRGAAEVALFRTEQGREAEAAFAIEADYRRNGLGRALLRRAALHARNRGAARIHIATERENRAMLRLAMASGARFEVGAAEANGVLSTAPRTVFSLCLEWVEQEAGVIRWSWERAQARLARIAARLKPRRPAAARSAS